MNHLNSYSFAINSSGNAFKRNCSQSVEFLSLFLSNCFLFITNKSYFDNLIVCSSILIVEWKYNYRPSIRCFDEINEKPVNELSLRAMAQFHIIIRNYIILFKIELDIPSYY